MNIVVKYDNYMNSLNFNGFTSVDFNLLMALCSRLRGKDTNELIFTFNDLRRITGYKQTSVKKFISDLERMNEKLMKVTCKLRIESKSIMFVLFPTFITDSQEQILTVAVNEKFKFILNEIIKNFTRFDLNEFVQLDSKYSKNLYRLLKQYRMTGRYDVSIMEFRKRMDCPTSYSNKYIMDLIIKPALKELQNHFENLQCKPKYAKKRGRPVLGYVFTFEPEKTTDSEETWDKSKGFHDKAKNQKDGFFNFSQREYDYEELEKKILGSQLGTEHDDLEFSKMLHNETKRT